MNPFKFKMRHVGSILILNLLILSIPSNSFIMSILKPYLNHEMYLTGLKYIGVDLTEGDL